MGNLGYHQARLLTDAPTTSRPAATTSGPDGSPAIEITPRRRAEPGPSNAELEEMFPEPALIDPAELARKLVGGRTTRTTIRR